jgi:hypothetical protein
MSHRYGGYGSYGDHYRGDGYSAGYGGDHDDYTDSYSVGRSGYGDYDRCSGYNPYSTGYNRYSYGYNYCPYGRGYHYSDESSHGRYSSNPYFNPYDYGNTDSEPEYYSTRTSRSGNQAREDAYWNEYDEHRRHPLTAAHLRRIPTGMVDISHDKWQDGRRGLIDDMRNLSERVRGPFWG